MTLMSLALAGKFFTSSATWEAAELGGVFSYIFWAPKSLQMVIVAIKLKDAYSLEGKLRPT